MTTIIQSVKIPESDALNATTQRHLNKLAEKFPWLITARVYFKVENSKTENKNTCEIELSGPGPRIYATTTDAYFEAAMKETISDLERQLKKRKRVFNKH